MKAKKSKFAHIIGKHVEVPGSEWGLPTSGIFFRGRVLKKDPCRSHCVVVKMEDGTRYFWPGDNVSKWLEEMRYRNLLGSGPANQAPTSAAPPHPSTKAVKEESFSAEDNGMYDEEYDDAEAQLGAAASAPDEADELIAEILLDMAKQPQTTPDATPTTTGTDTVMLLDPAGSPEGSPADSSETDVRSPQPVQLDTAPVPTTSAKLTALPQPVVRVPSTATYKPHGKAGGLEMLGLAAEQQAQTEAAPLQKPAQHLVAQRHVAHPAAANLPPLVSRLQGMAPGKTQAHPFIVKQQPVAARPPVMVPRRQPSQPLLDDDPFVSPDAVLRPSKKLLAQAPGPRVPAHHIPIVAAAQHPPALTKRPSIPAPLPALHLMDSSAIQRAIREKMQLALSAAATGAHKVPAEPTWPVPFAHSRAAPMQIIQLKKAGSLGADVQLQGAVSLPKQPTKHKPPTAGSGFEQQQQQHSKRRLSEQDESEGPVPLPQQRDSAAPPPSKFRSVAPHQHRQADENAILRTGSGTKMMSSSAAERVDTAHQHVVYLQSTQLPQGPASSTQQDAVPKGALKVRLPSSFAVPSVEQPLSPGSSTLKGHTKSEPQDQSAQAPSPHYPCPPATTPSSTQPLRHWPKMEQQLLAAPSQPPAHIQPPKQQQPLRIKLVFKSQQQLAPQVGAVDR